MEDKKVKLYGSTQDLYDRGIRPKELSSNQRGQLVDLYNYLDESYNFEEYDKQLKSKSGLMWIEMIMSQEDIDRIQKEYFEGYFDDYWYNWIWRKKGFHKFRVVTPEEKRDKSYGIYGMYRNDELIYIGYTMKSFEKRWNEHMVAIKNKIPRQQLYVYGLIEWGDEIDFKVLIDAQGIETNEPLTERDWQCMELALIQMYQPEGNLAGRTYEYKFTEHNRSKQVVKK